MQDFFNLGSNIIKLAKNKNVANCDVILVSSSNTSYSQRLGNFENIENSQSNDIGIRVFIAEKNNNKIFKSSVISTNNLSKENIEKTLDRVIFNAKIAPPDEFTRLAVKGEYCENLINDKNDLELFDDTEIDLEALKNLAEKCEDSALAVKGITNSDGAESSFSKNNFAIISSEGFFGSQKSSSFGFNVSVISGNEKIGMETDYDFSTAIYFEDLENPEIIGRNAGKKAIAKLKPKKIKTIKAPVIFDKRVAKSILGNFLAAINGNSIVKKSSFLSDAMHKKIFNSNIEIIDNPLVKRGFASQIFDAEGLACKEVSLVKEGVLQNWILDIRTASKLGLKSNARASRGISSQPYPATTNVYMKNGDISYNDLIKSVKRGVYITEIFGMGVNYVSGDYSQGASGFMIENGEISYPISEITIAGNLLEMFKNLTPANDLEFKYSKNSPTILIEGMTIAGE